jgi:beta-galactosidase
MARTPCRSGTHDRADGRSRTGGAARANGTLRAVSGRERLLIDEGWRFQKDDAPGTTLPRASLLPWLLPTSNAFIANPAQRKARPAGRLGADLPYARRR